MEDLTADQLDLCKKAFNAFDHDKKGAISTESIGTILEMLGKKQTDRNLRDIIGEFDIYGTGELDFDDFCKLASRFIVEEEDMAAIEQELREAFRLYDKEGYGYITTDVLREILLELEPDMSDEDLDNMIDEIDADGSGTVDFEEFMEVMTGE
ncbi:hypothetical protein LSTR_LSTR005555 [Laodelphax striatellus]|uniref:EF-hand domain-containing protein n=1 Tax=Laodelphax striatellus TaxID=195883 RepID=A0A482WXF7_LAOST|nr:hypothetical protein LSTR_LSTR005555 [Laodelphax striatellus]